MLSTYVGWSQRWSQSLMGDHASIFALRYPTSFRCSNGIFTFLSTTLPPTLLLFLLSFPALPMSFSPPGKLSSFPSAQTLSVLHSPPSTPRLGRESWVGIFNSTYSIQLIPFLLEWLRDALFFQRLKAKHNNRQGQSFFPPSTTHS
jgi:hypothetical protein